MGFRVRDCSGNPFVFFLKKTKDCSGKPDPQGHALLVVMGSLYIVYCILYIDVVVTLGLIYKAIGNRH